MAKYSVALIFLTFFNTLCLVAGISVVYATAKFDMSTEDFYYAIKEFILLYQIIFFAFGLLQLVLSLFGFIAMFFESKLMLDVFGKLLFSLLLLLFMVFCVCIWSKGPGYLHSTMSKAFSSYNIRNCHLDRSIDALQSKFFCCGVESPKDWDSIRANQKMNISLEPPLSCCDPNLIYKTYPHTKEHGELKCMAIYENGCYTPVLRYITRIFYIIDIIGIVIALDMALAIICVFQFISILKEDSVIAQTQSLLDNNVINALPVQLMSQNIYQDEFGAKNVHSSTAV